MQLTNTTSRRLAGTFSLLAALVLSLAALTTPALGATTTEVITGNPDCSTIGETFHVKWDNMDQGVPYEVGDTHIEGDVTFTVESINGDGEALDVSFVSGTPIGASLYKSGNSSTVTYYDPPVTSATISTQGQGGSHIELCVGQEPDPADPGADAEFCVDGGVLITLTNAPGEAGPGDPVTFDVFVDVFDDGPGSAFTTTELLDNVVAYGDTETLHVAIDEDVYIEISVYTDDNPSQPLATFNDTQDCEDPPVNAPAASIVDSCDLGAVVVTLDNTGSDETVTYTVTVNGVSTDHDVAPSDDPLVLEFPIEEDGTYDVNVVADGLDPVSTSGTLDCEDPAPTPTPTPDASEPDSGVLPDATERPNPAPDPTPAPDPAPEPEPEPEPQVEAAQEQLPETGMESMDLLLLALLLAGLGTALLLAPAPRRNDGFAA